VGLIGYKSTMETDPSDRPRRVVVGFSGGVTSAWCAGWALRTFPRDEVDLLWHDTKEEDPDTYRFLREMATALGKPIIERSDGRSVTQLFRDEGMLGNGQNTMCSRVLKAEQGTRYVNELKAAGYRVIKVVGYSAREPLRVAKMVGRMSAQLVEVRFPIIEEGVTKQQCADWCQCEMGVRPSQQYEHFEHANCRGCVKGGRAYWLKTYDVYPDVFEQRAQLEEEFGHTIIRGGDRDHPTLRQLVQIGLKRTVRQREQIEIGACDCGD
jgi:Phosphoadenosine phosphosulfate reductase family